MHNEKVGRSPFPLSACSTHLSKPPIRVHDQSRHFTSIYGDLDCSPQLGAFLEIYCNCWHEALAQGNLTQCSLGVCMQHDLTHSITTLTLPYTSPPPLFSEIMNNNVSRLHLDTHQHQAECQMAERMERLTAAGLHQAC